MQARQLGLLLQSVYIGAQHHRTHRRDDAEPTPYINGSFNELDRLYKAGERDIATLCTAVLEGTDVSFADVDASYALVGDDRSYADGEIELIIAALAFAALKHRNQSRKDAAGTPYIIHPIEVLHVVFQIGGERDPVTILACILHDTVEDTGTTFEELAERFGAEVASVVKELTDDKSLAKEERKRLQVEHAAHKTGRAKIVKYGDKSANVADVCKAQGWSQQRRREYIEWAASIVRQFAGHNVRLDVHFEKVAAEALELIAAA